MTLPLTEIEATRAAIRARRAEQPTWLDKLRAIHGTEDSLARAVAERLFTAHNASKGAAYPGGFGFIAPAKQQRWIERAQRLLLVDGAGLPHRGGDA